MFDDELPEDQCQLLARRLSRDDAMKERWRRYAVVGAAIRSQRQAGAMDVRLETNLAARVSSVISSEPALTGDAVAKGEGRKLPGMRWWQPVVGGAIAAGVAAMSVLWIRAQGPVGAEGLFAQNAAAPVTVSQTLQVQADTSAPQSYVVPAVVERTPIVPTAELANYVVAHSEFSAPMSRRNLLSALVASESANESGSEQGTGEPLDQSDDANAVEVRRQNVEKAK
jgi:negative regulator of sigma E activity